MILNFIKIGGSVITDKNTPLTFNERAAKIAARAIATYHKTHKKTGLIVGTGAGSYGHYYAQKYAPQDKKGYTDEHATIIHSSVSTLNALFVQKLLDEGVAVVSLPAIGYLEYNSGKPRLYSDVLRKLLGKGVVVSIYGDMIPNTNGWAVASTESLFIRLASQLQSDYELQKCILGTNVPGVLDESGNLLPTIVSLRQNATQATFDITGGMASKVRDGRELATLFDTVRIVDATNQSVIRESLAGVSYGTLIPKV